jgi:hypothetical protein
MQSQILYLDLMTSFYLFQAVDYFQRVLGLQEDNGEVWSALGKILLLLLPFSQLTFFRSLLPHAG